jgi:hypothetical protein
MRKTIALFALLAAVLSARGADDASAAIVRVGDTYQQVLAKRGHPASEMSGGTVRILYYPDAHIKLRNDAVVDVTAVAGAQAGAAGPKDGTTAPGAGPPASFVFKDDAVEEEIGGFERIVLGRLEAQKFAELEILSAHVIGEKSVFPDGSWKILRFHEALEPSDDESEAKWGAREAEIEKWEQQVPGSVTARTVHVGFLASYAWHARGAGSADSSKGFGGPLFNNRLAQAADLFQSTRRAGAKSPMLWFEGQRVALGQGWPAKEVEGDFEDAKRAEPGFWHYDGPIARFLLPRWWGNEGDWEKFEEAEIQRSDGLGVEGYARAVYEMSGYYKNIFKESHAEWAWVKEGYAVLFGKYPDSRGLVNQYALLAVLASDRSAARAAFGAMKGQADPSVWRRRDISEFSGWASGGP